MRGWAVKETDVVVVHVVRSLLRASYLQVRGHRSGRTWTFESTQMKKNTTLDYASVSPDGSAVLDRDDQHGIASLPTYTNKCPPTEVRRNSNNSLMEGFTRCKGPVAPVV